jgi:starch-binding outer membrane protein SusE/F
MRKLPHKFLIIICLFVVPFFHCRKQVDFARVPTHDHLPALSLRVSSSNINLYQANAKLTAIRFDWGYSESIVPEAYYVLQFSLKDDQFKNVYEIALGSSMAASFTVEEFNQYMHKIINPGDGDDVSFRIKYMNSAVYKATDLLDGEINYSDPLLIHVNTYRDIISYESPNFITIPGNYQSWDPLTSPRLVSKPGEKEYEGYVYFPIEYPQFLMIRGNQWYDFTFGHIGDGKFGFNGTPLSIFGGIGPYLVRANLNTNTWSYTKIKTWGVVGTAVSGNNVFEIAVSPDLGKECIWRLNVNLVEGTFHFRANGDNKFLLGNTWPATDHIPDYNSDAIQITKAGNYTIELDLSIPGNYLYHLHLNK